MYVWSWLFTICHLSDQLISLFIAVVRRYFERFLLILFNWIIVCVYNVHIYIYILYICIYYIYICIYNPRTSHPITLAFAPPHPIFLYQAQIYNIVHTVYVIVMPCIFLKLSLTIVSILHTPPMKNLLRMTFLIHGCYHSNYVVNT